MFSALRSWYLVIHEPPIHAASGLLKGIVTLLGLAKQDADPGHEHLGALSFKCLPQRKSSSVLWGQTGLSVASRKSPPGPQNHNEFEGVWAIGKNCLQIFTPLGSLLPAGDNPGPHLSLLGHS